VPRSLAAAASPAFAGTLVLPDLAAFHPRRTENLWPVTAAAIPTPQAAWGML